MPEVNCLICGKYFYIKPFHHNKGWGKYCSIRCRNKSQLKGKTKICFSCGKEIYRSLGDIKKSESKRFFCNKSCQTIWRNKVLYSGENHSNWKGGDSVYKRILLRSKIKKVCKRCGEIDMRILTAHHIDSNRHNNKVENLLWLCHNCHYLIHHDKVENKKFMEVLV